MRLGSTYVNLLKVCLPKHCKVLLLEDSDIRIEWFRDRVPELTVVKTVDEFKEFFAHQPTVDFLFLDHDLGLLDSSGEDAAQYLHDNFGMGGKYTIIHSWNRAGAERMRTLLPNALVVPFGEFEVEVKQ